jgi:signal peptidase I
VIEWVAVVGGALVVALVIRAFFLAAFYIPSESMSPTLEKGDRVLVNKLSYKLHDVHRGDIVVFGRPPNEPDNGIKDLIKRVVALPGETVEVRDCKVLINGQALVEPYVKEWSRTCTSPPVTVGQDQVFVMGDNRDDSQDSRFFGPISQHLIVGRAFVIVWPFTHLGWL